MIQVKSDADEDSEAAQRKSTLRVNALVSPDGNSNAAGDRSENGAVSRGDQPGLIQGISPQAKVVDQGFCCAHRYTKMTD
jgi:hypothetical protein